jgi:hypothetical protein
LINSNRGKTITFGGSGPDRSTAQFFGYPYSEKPELLSVSPVPEPQTYAMLFSGLILIYSIVGRRKPKPLFRNVD